jgi:hypothetical protein
VLVDEPITRCPSLRAIAAGRRRLAARTSVLMVLAWVGASFGPKVARAQGKPAADPYEYVTPKNLRHDVIYGVGLGLVYAGVDQARDRPSEWGSGSSGFGKRVASNVGAFLVQESVTAGLSAAMQRPVRYRRCDCTGTGRRLTWALSGAFADPVPGGGRVLATPRIAGAFAGAAAQAAWRPEPANGRVASALLYGGSSLVIGAGINVIHEFWWPWGKKPIR